MLQEDLYAFEENWLDASDDTPPCFLEDSKWNNLIGLQLLQKLSRPRFYSGFLGLIRKMTLTLLLRQRALKIPSLIAAARRFNSSLVETKQDGEIFLVSIARPEKRNAVDAETAKELADAFRHFEIDDESSVAVLYGKGDTFCAGYDLEYLSTRGPDEFLRWLTPPGEGDGPMVRYNVYVYDRH